MLAVRLSGYSLPFAPPPYAALDRAQGSVGAIWEALLPHESPMDGQGLAEPPHPRPSPQGGEGRVSSKLQPSPLCGRGWRGEAVLPIAPGEGGRQCVSELAKASTKPNKPKRLNMPAVNEIAREAEKQTQARYQPWCQSLTAILAPILKKFVWIASCPIADSGAAASASVAAQA